MKRGSEKLVEKKVKVKSLMEKNEMATFEQPTSGNASAWDLSKENPPAGSFVAKIIDVKDEFGVTRPNFENPAITETYNRTQFLFGFRDRSGAPHRVSTKWMKISGNEKSALYGFLKGLKGKPFAYGQDYTVTEDKGGVLGASALITITLEPRKMGGGFYPSISSAIPVPDGFTTPAAPVAQDAPPPAPPAPAAPITAEAPANIPF